MKIGIIIARFQTHALTQAHVKLIKHVHNNNDKTAIFLGTNRATLTKYNPLSFEARKRMIQSDYPTIEVHELKDHKYNAEWTKNLDKTLSALFEGHDITLYGGRDSFMQHYTGKHRPEIFPEIPNVSATDCRDAEGGRIRDEEEWRCGIIYASANRHPVSYQTVDIAIINFDTKQLLLGKKENEYKHRFVGGFVDVKDDNLEYAAKREAREECGDISTDQYEYVGSFRLDDWRYRKAQDKIMTALFCCHFIYGHVKAQDDIAELKWFSLDTLTIDDFEPEHKPLFEALKNYLWEKEHDKK